MVWGPKCRKLAGLSDGEYGVQITTRGFVTGGEPQIFK